MANPIYSIIKEADTYYGKLDALNIGNAKELRERFILKQIDEIVRKEYSHLNEKLYKKNFCIN